MKPVNLDKPREPRKGPFLPLSHDEQVRAINKLFMACGTDTCARLRSELNAKRRGYYRQDAAKGRATSLDQIISFDELVESLVASKLICKYCNRGVFLFYPSVRDPLQWTLDRVDNALAHTLENTCVSCLQCNLQRRQRSHDAFVFTKKLRVAKAGGD